MKIYHLLKKITLKAFILSFFLQLVACGIYKPVDTRKVPVNVNKRVEKNIQEGRGFRVFDSRKKSSGEFEFASSNPLWRATIDLLDFAPFSNVDYSGGIIITDWYNGDNVETNEFLKITVRFLSNEIRADGLDVIVHKKKCDPSNRCEISKLETDLTDKIKIAILKDAAILEESRIANGADKDFILREPKN